MVFMLKSILIIIGLALLGLALFSKRITGKSLPVLPKVIVSLVAVSILSYAPGIYRIPEKHSGHVEKTVGKQLPMGRLMAFSSKGEKGLQTQLLQPGWGHDFQYPWTMDIKNVPDLEVPTGRFAVLTARDGKMNPNIAAEKWDLDNVDMEKMFNDVEYFIENGGERGIQQHILTTGVYRLNQYQWKEIRIHSLTEVDADEVLVIESKFGKAPPFKKTSDDEILSVPLVESEDYRGIVNNAYASGFYPIHPEVSQGHKVSIVLQTFIFGGGYESEALDLVIDPENDKLITERKPVNPIEQENGPAFEAKTKDSHTVRYDVRVLGQVEPIQAPRFVGTIKDEKTLNKKVIEPFTRNILSNITLEYDAYELKNKKEEIGERVSELLRERTIKTGFRTKTVEITNIDIPPIVLIPEKIKSASTALENALVEKEKSVRQAIKVRNMQDQADSQEALAQATVANQAADQKAEAIEKLAEANRIKAQKEADAERYRIEQQTEANEERIVRVAKSYKALAESIGKDNAAGILLQETINMSADKFNGPDVVVFGEGAEGSSIVSSHMISESIKTSVNNQTKNGAVAGSQ